MKEKINKFINHNKVFIYSIYGLIFLNLTSVIIESFENIRLKYSNEFYLFEVISIIVFTIEYFLRIWTADLHYKIKNKSRAKIKFITSAFGLIDLFAILPFYLPFIAVFDFRVLRILRLLRLFRIFKLGRFSKSMKMIVDVLNETKSDLIITFFIVSITLILSATIMFEIENHAQPDKFQNILQTLWWAVATLTTVGYGDIYPITPLGKFFTGIFVILTIGLIALPTAIISSAFIARIQKEKSKQKHICPHCGKSI